MRTTRRFLLLLAGALATCALFSSAAEAAPASWSTPDQVDQAFSASAFSCASSTDCVVVGTGKGSPSVQEYSVFDGTSWIPLRATSALSSQGISTLSCAPASSFCLAGTAFNGYLTDSGGTWSSVSPVTSSQDSSGTIDAISCLTSSDCIGVLAGGQTVTYNGTTMTTSATAPTFTVANGGVSCASASLCVAISATQAAVYDGTSWSAPTTLVDSTDSADGDALTSVSCAPGTTTCVISDSSGISYAYDYASGTVVTQSQSIDSYGLDSIACTAGANGAVDCVALGDDGEAFSTTAPMTDGSWSSGVPDQLEPGGSALASCPSDSQCAAVDDIAFSAANGGPTDTSWTPGPTLGSGGLNAVSCAPDTTTCALVDDAGRVVVVAGSTTYPARDIDGRASLLSVSCPSAAKCLAADANGVILTFDPSNWANGAGATSTQQLDSAGFAAISCSSTTFCMAVGFDGRWFTYDGQFWSGGSQSFDAAGNFPDAVSCVPGNNYCVATDYSGNAFTYNGTSWSAAKAIDTGDGLDSISCASASFCMAGDLAGGFLTYNGQTWTSAQGTLRGQPIEAVNCPTAGTCQLGGVADLETFTGGQLYSTNAAETADVTGISCSSTAFCMAVDDAGNLSVTTGVPALLSAPLITGSAVQGGTLNATTGSWLGSPTAYTYQWLACPTLSTCAPVSGARSASYTIPALTQAETYEVQVTAYNPYGSASATAGPSGTASPLVAANTVAPRITGTVAVNKKLTASPGTWTSATTPTYSYQWYLCAGLKCAAIAKATTASLTVTAADIGQTITVVVYAHNSAGLSKPAVAKLTGAVAAPAATLTSWLNPLNHLSGTAGHLSRIKKAKGYKATFDAAIAGKVSVTWTVTQKIAHSKKTRTVTVATAKTTSTKAAKRATIIVRLTAAGQKLLKNLKTEKVTITDRFTYAYGTSSRTATVHRTATLAH